MLQYCNTGHVVRSPPGTATVATATAPKQTAVKKQSAASILSTFTASTPSHQHHTPSVSKKPTPPPATPTSPKLDLGSPKESEGQPKRVPIPSANKSFEMFKKQALEKSERVCMNVHVTKLRITCL